MNIKFNYEKLLDIMKAFYSITKTKIIIFDKNHNTICSYPESDCAFCSKMKLLPFAFEKCNENDIHFFKECKKNDKLMLYTCHAGLVEACAPLKLNGNVIAYIMFGQISDLLNRNALEQNIKYLCKEYDLNEKEFIAASKTIKLKSYESIMATAKIFEACISYIILNEMLTPEYDRIISKCEEYIEKHLADIDILTLCKHLSISRTSLYEIFKSTTGMGIAEFIRNKKFERAKNLLLTTELKINEISDLCGFNDYNYFSRVFKKKYKKSPKEIRRKGAV